MTGLEAAADGCLAKPVLLNELIACIRAVLRRRAARVLNSIVQIGPLKLDPGRRRVLHGDAEVKLTPTGFRLLHVLMLQPERVHSRLQLLDQVWGHDAGLDERTVDVHVKRLRESLERVNCSQMVETIRGAGYRFRLLQALFNAGTA